MQSDHQNWRPRLRWHLRTQYLGSATQDGKCPLPGFTQFGAARKRNTGLKHRGIIGGLGSCEFKIGLAQPIERSKWLRSAIVPCLLEHDCEPLESTQREVGEKFIAVAEMAIGGSWTDTCPP